MPEISVGQAANHIEFNGCSAIGWGLRRRIRIAWLGPTHLVATKLQGERYILMISVRSTMFDLYFRFFALVLFVPSCFRSLLRLLSDSALRRWVCVKIWFGWRCEQRSSFSTRQLPRSSFSGFRRFSIFGLAGHVCADTCSMSKLSTDEPALCA